MAGLRKFLMELASGNLVENDVNAEHQDALQKTGFWGKAAAGCLFMARSTGRILIAHRSPYVEEPGTWGSWGGAMDGNESPAQAVAREAHEEAGVVVDQDDIIPMFVFKHESGFRYFNFLVLVDDEFEPKMDWETQGYKWVEYGNWPSPIHFGIQLLINDAKSAQTMQRLAKRYSAGN